MASVDDIKDYLGPVSRVLADATAIVQAARAETSLPKAKHQITELRARAQHLRELLGTTETLIGKKRPRKSKKSKKDADKPAKKKKKHAE
jgi:hypothetical protein